jgi:hypothetical protein
MLSFKLSPWFSVSGVSPETLVLNLNQMPANYTKKDNLNIGKTDVC